MSQNTGINESLIVARKWSDANQDKPPTRFVSLDRFPSDEQEALELCEKLSRGTELDNGWGTVSFWPSSRIESGDWSPGIWRDPILAEASFQFLKDENFVPLGSLAGVHVHATGQVLRGSFKRSDASESGSFPIIKSKGADAQQTLRSIPDEYWMAKVSDSGGREHTEKTLAKSGHLLITAGQNTQTARLTAVAGKKLIGHGWMPVSGLSKQESQALVVFLNSTVGRLLLMRTRGKTLSFPNYSTAEHKQVVIPNVRANSQVREILVRCYGETCNVLVPQFRDGECNVRKTWDEAVERAIGLDGGTLDDLRHRLNKEPSVRGIGYTDCSEANEEDYEEDEFQA